MYYSVVEQVVDNQYHTTISRCKGWFHQLHLLRLQHPIQDNSLMLMKYLILQYWMVAKYKKSCLAYYIHFHQLCHKNINPLKVQIQKMCQLKVVKSLLMSCLNLMNNLVSLLKLRLKLLHHYYHYMR